MNSDNNLVFFADAMLGNIAKKLRLLGYDVKYSPHIKDKQLLEYAKNENCIIISKDLVLINRLQKINKKCILITKSSEIEQCLEIMQFVRPDKLEINGERSRCTRCNSETVLIDKKNIAEYVPKKVLDYNEKFWKCHDCGQIYWEGTHIKNLQKFVNDLNERL